MASYYAKKQNSLDGQRTLAQSLVRLMQRETNQIQHQYILYCPRAGFSSGEDIWYVGDAPSDMECAHRAGVLPVQMVTQLTDPRQFHDFPAQMSFNNAAELQKFCFAAINESGKHLHSSINCGRKG